MANNLRHCGRDTKAKAYRLPSDKSAYQYQHLLKADKCKVCGRCLMAWKGEYHEGGNFTALFDVPLAEQPVWERRIDCGEAIPEAQLTSEWSQRAARPADVAIFYHRKIFKVQRREAL